MADNDQEVRVLSRSTAVVAALVAIPVAILVGMIDRSEVVGEFAGIFVASLMMGIAALWNFRENRMFPPFVIGLVIIHLELLWLAADLIPPQHSKAYLLLMYPDALGIMAIGQWLLRDRKPTTG